MRKVETTEANKAQIAELQSYTQQIIAAFKGYIDSQKQAIDNALQEQKMHSEMMQRDMDRVASTVQKQPVSVSVDSDNTAKMLEEMAAGFAARMDAITQQMEAAKTIGIERVRDPVTGKMIGGRVLRADGSINEVPIK